MTPAKNLAILTGFKETKDSEIQLSLHTIAQSPNQVNLATCPNVFENGFYKLSLKLDLEAINESLKNQYQLEQKAIADKSNGIKSSSVNNSIFSYNPVANYKETTVAQNQEETSYENDTKTTVQDVSEASVSIQSNSAELDSIHVPKSQENASSTLLEPDTSLSTAENINKSQPQETADTLVKEKDEDYYSYDNIPTSSQKAKGHAIRQLKPKLFDDKGNVLTVNRSGAVVKVSVINRKLNTSHDHNSSSVTDTNNNIAPVTSFVSKGVLSNSTSYEDSLDAYLRSNNHAYTGRLSLNKEKDTEKANSAVQAQVAEKSNISTSVPNTENVVYQTEPLQQDNAFASLLKDAFSSIQNKNHEHASPRVYQTQSSQSEDSSIEDEPKDTLNKSNVVSSTQDKQEAESTPKHTLEKQSSDQKKEDTLEASKVEQVASKPSNSQEESKDNTSFASLFEDSLNSTDLASKSKQDLVTNSGHKKTKSTIKSHLPIKSASTSSYSSQTKKLTEEQNNNVVYQTEPVQENSFASLFEQSITLSDLATNGKKSIRKLSSATQPSLANHNNTHLDLQEKNTSTKHTKAKAQVQTQNQAPELVSEHVHTKVLASLKPQLVQDDNVVYQTEPVQESSFATLLKQSFSQTKEHNIKQKNNLANAKHSESDSVNTSQNTSSSINTDASATTADINVSSSATNTVNKVKPTKTVIPKIISQEKETSVPETINEHIESKSTLGALLNKAQKAFLSRFKKDSSNKIELRLKPHDVVSAPITDYLSQGLAYPTEDATAIHHKNYLAQQVNTKADLNSENNYLFDDNESFFDNVDDFLNESSYKKKTQDPLKTSSGYKHLVHITIDINNQRKGSCIIEKINNHQYIAHANFYDEQGELNQQPFLLHYDLVNICFNLHFSDNTKVVLYSDFCLCASRNQEDTANINQILNELTSLDNDYILGLMFQQLDLLNQAQNEQHRSFKSLSSYVALLSSIVDCYKSNLAYFKTQSKHIITKENSPVPYNKVKSVNHQNYRWLAQNLEELIEVSQDQGLLRYANKSYLPLHLQNEVSKKSFDIYENRVVVGFIKAVLHNALRISSEYKEFITQHQKSYNLSQKESMQDSKLGINQSTNVALDESSSVSTTSLTLPTLSTSLSSNTALRNSEVAQAPIMTLKQIQINLCQKDLEKLQGVIEDLNLIYVNYAKFFNIRDALLQTFPHKAKAFQEIRPYAQVFQNIMQWFSFGDYRLDKDRTFLDVKTLDKLFEYYCLYRLLEMLTDNGFMPCEDASFSYQYEVPDSMYENVTNVANTYKLKRGLQTVTLYYQPIISNNIFENDMFAYRTTRQGNYFTPDFILKFNSGTTHLGDDDYIIFDAKFAQRNTVIRYYLKDLVQKYGLETSIAVTKLKSDANQDLVQYHEDAQDLIELSQSKQSSIKQKQDLYQTFAESSKITQHNQNNTMRTYEKYSKQSYAPQSKTYHTGISHQNRQVSYKENKKQITTKRAIFNQLSNYQLIGTKPPKMIFALQGRINENNNSSSPLKNIEQSSTLRTSFTREQVQTKRQPRPIWLFHNSPLGRKLPPQTAIGLVEFNTIVDASPALWNEITKNIPYLKN